MMTHSAPFPCDPQLWQRFLAACNARDESPGAVLRDLVRQEVHRHSRRAARGDTAPDGRFLGRLRVSVAQALAGARTWEQMQAALHLRGLAYVASGGGLALIDPETGEVLCQGAQVGPTRTELAQRFGAGFPGHTRPGLAALALAAVQPGPAAFRA